MYQRILVPFDGSGTSRRALDEAIKLAALTGASIRLVHLQDVLTFATGFETYSAYADSVIPLMHQAGEKILQEAKARVEKAGVSVDTVLLEGMASRLSDAVADQVKTWGAELVVIGTHGRRGVGRMLLGSDAEQIARTATVPVLLIRAPEVTGSAAGSTLTTTATARSAVAA